MALNDGMDGTSQKRVALALSTAAELSTKGALGPSAEDAQRRVRARCEAPAAAAEPGKSSCG